jgi:hypothetical protein
LRIQQIVVEVPIEAQIEDVPITNEDTLEESVLKNAIGKSNR